MRTSKLFACAAILAVLCGTASGQCLTTTFAGGNGFDGNMFDIVCLNPAGVTIQGFSCHLGAGTHDIEIWVRTNTNESYLGFQNAMAGWTLVGSATGVISNGANTPTPVPINVNVALTMNEQRGFYITNLGGPQFTYTNGTAQGAVFVADSNIQILEGHGGGYFNLTNVPRVVNAEVNYTFPGAVQEYQTNQPEMGLTINGVIAGCSGAPIVSQQVIDCSPLPLSPVTGTIQIESDQLGGQYDIVMSGVGILPVSGGALTLPDGQIVNLNLAAPISFLGVNSFPNFIPGQTSAQIDLGYSLTTATQTTMQAVAFVASAPLGVLLSQATELDVQVTPPPTSIAGPITTTQNVTVNLTQAPTCWCPGGMPFYGTSFSEMHVSTNGYVSFGGTDTDTTPSLLDAINDDGRVGFWTNFDASEGGTITISNPAANLVRVDYAGVFYDAGGPGNTFSIQFNCMTGEILIDGLQGLMPNTGTSTTDDQWLGISPGISLAPQVTTDPGPAGFALSGLGTAMANTDMLYEFNDTSVSLMGLPASVMGGMNSLLIVPDGMGNYGWAGL